MKFDSHDGYRLAARIDKILNTGLTKYDPDKQDTHDGWNSCLRTVQIGLNIIQKMMDHAKPPPCPTCGHTKEKS